MPAPTSLLDAPYALTDDQKTRFREQGFIHFPGVFDRATLEAFDAEITRLTLEHNPLADVPLERRYTYGKAFIQVGNLWERCPEARSLTFSKRLARIAAELLGTRGVRLWHDQALYKEPAGGFTPWHADQQYWPMASGLSVTAWIPLHAVPLEMGPLSFARGSHRKRIGREPTTSRPTEPR